MTAAFKEIVKKMIRLLPAILPCGTIKSALAAVPEPAAHFVAG